MQICPDPLVAARSVGPNQRLCVPLPASYPTIFSYVPTNVEYNNQKTSNTIGSNFNIKNYDCTNILNSSLCANSQLIQRIRQKIDLYQTSSLNDTRQISKPLLTNNVKQPVSDSVSNQIAHEDIQKRINPSNQLQSDIQQDLLPTYNSIILKTKNPSLLQQDIERKITDEHTLSKHSPYPSRLPNSLPRSTNLSTNDIRINESSSHFLPNQSLQSSVKVNENHFKKIDSQNILDSSPTDDNNRVSMVMSIPVPSISSISHFSEQQVVSSQLRQPVHNMIKTGSHQDNSIITASTPNINDHSLGDDRIINAIDSKSTSFLSPSHHQQRINRESSSSKQIISAIPSSAISNSDFEQQKLPEQSSTSTYLSGSPSINSQYSNQVQHTLEKSNKNIDPIGGKNDFQSQSHKIMHSDKIKKRNNWMEKLTKKISSKYLNITKFNNLSSDNISHMYTNHQNNLHMREAMAALELDLTKEAYQALINKKKDSQQNRFLRILTAPSRCCRSCRTQQRLATLAQRSINIAIKDVPIPTINSTIQ